MVTKKILSHFLFCGIPNDKEGCKQRTLCMSENAIIYRDENITLKDGGDRKLITISHSFTLKEIVHAIERYSAAST